MMDLILFGWQLFASRTVLLDVTVVFLHSALKVISRPSCVANVLASLMIDLGDFSSLAS